MKIAIAQINFVVGDLQGNADKIADAAQRARAGGATLLLTTELGLCGYPPEDLLLRNDFYRACDEALHALARRVHGITAVVGHPHAAGDKHYNAASVLHGGAVVTTYLKHRLPNYTVFDEERYFDSGTVPCVFEHEGLRVGLKDARHGASSSTRGCGSDSTSAPTCGRSLPPSRRATPAHRRFWC